LGTFWLKIEQFWPFELNFAEMILRWSPFKIGSVSAVLYPRWPPLLKIEISSNTFWFKIEQFWPFEEISILSNGSHLGYRTALTDTILKGDHLRIISAKFDSDWLSSFRGEDFFLNILREFFMNFELLPILTDYAN
jgi:hypothetical protein